MKTLGKTAMAEFIEEKLPTTKPIRSGDLGEILGTSYLGEFTAFKHGSSACGGNTIAICQCGERMCSRLAWIVGPQAKKIVIDFFERLFDRHKVRP